MIRYPILSLLWSIVLLLAICACGKQETADEPRPSTTDEIISTQDYSDLPVTTTEQTQASIPLEEDDENTSFNLGAFSGERAWVHKYADTRETVFCIDKTGKIVFYLPERYSVRGNYSDGYCNLMSLTGGLAVIDANGHIVFDEDAMCTSGIIDDVVAYGDGYILCHKYLATFDNDYDCYTVYDSKTLSWSAFISIPNSISSFLGTEGKAIINSAYYMGDGVFGFDFEYAYNNSYILQGLLLPRENSNEPQVVLLDPWTLSRGGSSDIVGTEQPFMLDLKFVDGKAFYHYEHINTKNRTVVGVSHYFGMIDRFGDISILESGELDFTTNTGTTGISDYHLGTVVARNAQYIVRLSGDNLNIYDVSANNGWSIFITDSLFRHYDDDFTSIELYEDKIVINNLAGTDNSKYYAVYDLTGSTIIPISKGYSAFVCGRLNVYNYDADTETIYDTEGKTIFSTDSNTQMDIAPFSDDLAICYDGDRQYYVDLNCSETLSSFTETADTLSEDDVLSQQLYNTETSPQNNYT